MLDRIYSKRLIPIGGKVELIASKRETNKFLNMNFKNYLNRQVAFKRKTKISVIIKTPYQEKCLQAVDFVSWAIFRKYERDDGSYYDLIKTKIIEENPLFS